MAKHFPILIIGGGNAGISLAAYLLLQDPKLKIGLVDPSEKHYYQPAWTLVGAGDFDIQATVRNQADLIPKGVEWVKDRCTSLLPDSNQVTVGSGETISYDFLVVCPGIQLDWHLVKGLPEALGKNGVCSNYSFASAPYTWETLQNFTGGKAIFHNPHTPVKCGGAPHKIMYMAADYFRKRGILDKADIQYWSGAARLFAVDKYEDTLKKVVERAGITLHLMQKLEEIDGPNKRAKFVGMTDATKDQVTWVDYDMIHIAPPQSAPDFVKQSPLANAAGWVEVDKHSLQHLRYPNVFALGDAAGLPTSKTGAAIRKQTPTVAANLLAAREGKPLPIQYNGYTCCPLVTGYGKLVLAEFDYNNQPQETFPFDQGKERWSMYQLKKQVLPRLYWGRILRGKSQG